MRWSSPFVRFLVGGAANTAIGYLLYLAAARVMDYRWAYTTSYLLGIGISYLINSLYVFRQPLSWRRLLAFPAVYALQYAAGLALLWLFVSRLGIHKEYAPLLVVPLTIPLTFVASRLVLTYRKRHEP
jgi:putative flippase GtrA